MRLTGWIVAAVAAAGIAAAAGVYACGSSDRTRCSRDADCPSSQTCTFAYDAGCAAVGECLDLGDKSECSGTFGGGVPPGGGCGCDGGFVEQVCIAPYLWNGPVNTSHDPHFACSADAAIVAASD